MKKVFILAVMFLLFASQAFAISKLTWVASTTDIQGAPITVDGYKAHCGNTSGNYNAPVDVGNVIEAQISSVVDITADGTYFCAVTAYTTLESAFSNEVSFIVSSGTPY